MQRLQYYVTRVLLGVVALAALVGVVGAWETAQASALLQTTTLSPGTSLTVSCATVLSVKMAADKKSLTVSCAAASSPTPKPSATKTKTPTAVVATKTATALAPAATRTRRPTRTSTVVPPTPTATPMHQHPTATPTSVQPTGSAPTATPMPSNGLDVVKPEILGSCTASVHDRFTVVGPDGQLYRTWHPQTVPVDSNNPNGPKCTFAHEHGDDPNTSVANPSLPPFGYVNAVAGSQHAEAHEGFKVFVANRGQTNDEGRVMQGYSRVVFHMGTGGVKRFTQPHHSAIVDLVMPSGHYIHVQGMFDTANVGSICQRDGSLGDSDPSNDVGRTVVILPGLGCDGDSLYEIWLGAFRVRNTAGNVVANIGPSVAVFDPITVMDPNDKTRLLYTADVFASRANEAPFMGPFHGCNREIYHPTPYWYNPNGPTVYYTDAFGNPGGPIRQEVSQHNQIGITLSLRGSEAQNIFKFRTDYCAPGLGLFN